LLTSCFSNYAKGYQRDIDQYVQWSGSLKTAITGVSLWHGTEDNWSPFAMATELHQLVEASQPVNSMVGPLALFLSLSGYAQNLRFTRER
jgi:hypothetical protein